MSKKNEFPVKDGWLHCKFSIEPGTELTERICLQFLGFKDPSECEVAYLKHYKTVVRMCFRKKRNADAAVA